jgi:hypothetical protein
MMKTLDEINRSINRALRAANQVAVEVAASPLNNRAAAIQEITQALAHIDALQRMLVADDPSLEYHFDPGRGPTPAMTRVRDLVECAEKHVEAGQLNAAAEALQRACDLEPPPLVYETIAKRLEEVKRLAR